MAASKKWIEMALFAITRLGVIPKTPVLHIPFTLVVDQTTLPA